MMSAEAWTTLAGAAVALVLAAIGAVAWIVRLEGRVAEHRAADESKLTALLDKIGELSATRDEVISMRSRVDQLEEKARQHGDLRDLVIEMRTEMRGVQTAIRDLAASLKVLADQGHNINIRDGGSR